MFKTVPHVKKQNKKKKKKSGENTSETLGDR